MEFEIVATTLFGLEQVLADELALAGAKKIEKQNRAVTFWGNKRLLYKANFKLRTALKILKPIHSFNAKSPEDLYQRVQEVNWNDWLRPSDTLLIESVVNSDHFNHSQFVSQKTKDAIVDQIRTQTGARPSVDLKNPTLRINLHIKGEHCNLSANSSGESLHKRGYRTQQHIAPLNEVLAAGLVLLSNWKGENRFIDPMCGGGTILAEAILCAQNAPPNLNREHFGFKSWYDFDQDLFDAVKDELRTAIKKPDLSLITAADISSKALEITKENLKNVAGGQAIQLQKMAFEKLEPPPGPGTVIMNPPYGERLGPVNMAAFYKSIGDRLKHYFKGYEVWILSANKEALKHIGLRPSEKHTLFNGPLECKFQKFSIYEGSLKSKKNTAP